VQITVLYFADAREAAGRTSEVIEVDADTDVDKLLGTLGARYPRLSGISLRVAVDEAFAAPYDRVPEGATVALLPPVGGG